MGGGGEAKGRVIIQTRNLTLQSFLSQSVTFSQRGLRLMVRITLPSDSISKPKMAELLILQCLERPYIYL